MKKAGFILVLLMSLLQGFYGLFAFLDPAGFAGVRGTVLVSPDDTDWVHIYASRTLFVSLIVGALLYYKNYRLLMIAALIGTVMPLTDGWLAYKAGAETGVIIKHAATVLYLLVTTVVLASIVKQESLKD